MLHARDVASLVRLLIVIQRASTDAAGWEDVNRLFIGLSESFSDEGVAALRAVREWINGDKVAGSDAASESAFDRLPAHCNRNDAVDALRDIVAPAVAEAVRHGTEREYSAANTARLDLCLEHCAQGMMTFAAGGDCLFLNRAAARLLKLPVEPKASLIDRRILPRPLQTLVEQFSARARQRSEWLPTRSFDVSGDRLQCFPLVVTANGARGPESLLNLFLIAEAGSDSLAERLLRRARLSRQETFVVRALLDGKSNGTIAKEMSLSVHTVRTYVERVYEKLDVANRYELMKLVTSMSGYPGVADTAG
ncbi:MAG TPA: helix-turn-helix transcriptional regulator [Thermoanaerobaculia bacterium]|nr:helix-turn-helix transcriptional regulator [Thermoanaerobaculia bacterium]